MNFPEYNGLSLGVPGLKKSGPALVTTRAAGEALPFGGPVFVRLGNNDQGFASPASAVPGVAAVYGGTITGSTSSEIGDATLTINGAIYTAQDLASGSTPTQAAAALVAAAAADPQYTVTNSSGALVVTAKVKGTAFNAAVITVTVPAGLTAPTVTRTTAGVDEVGTASLLGVALETAKEGLPQYYATEAANVMTKGIVLVTVVDAVLANAPAYLTSAQAWTDEASGNTATGYKFRTNAAAGELAELEVI